jgi:cystathionine gamma-synthase/methionine-gamma-lyase
MAADPSLHPETLTVGHGYDPVNGMGAAKPPIFLTSTFVYGSAAEAKDSHRLFFDGPREGEAAGSPHIYSRLGHPNLDMVEARLAALDGAEAAAGFATGLAAVSTILLAHLQPGDCVLHSLPVYGGTDMMIGQVMSRFGTRAFHFSDGLDGAAIRKAADQALAAGPLRMIWVESPANPTAAIVDIALVAQIAEEIAARQGFKPLLVVDNTFLGPFLQSPLKLGADLCMTSMTKYCGGHSDLLAGGVSGSQSLVSSLKSLRTQLGNPMDAFTAWLLLRSLETLHLRTERACANAGAIAAYLRDHPKVTSVNYLGLAGSGPGEAVMARQARGAGSTFSFRIKGGEAEAFRLLDTLKVIKLAVSLGGSETLICHPASTTHYPIPRDRLTESGVDESTLRLSVGIEHVDDLVADLSRGLDQV